MNDVVPIGQRDDLPTQSWAVDPTMLLAGETTPTRLGSGRPTSPRPHRARPRCPNPCSSRRSCRWPAASPRCRPRRRAVLRSASRSPPASCRRTGRRHQRRHPNTGSLTTMFPLATRRTPREARDAGRSDQVRCVECCGLCHRTSHSAHSGDQRTTRCQTQTNSTHTPPTAAPDPPPHNRRRTNPDTAVGSFDAMTSPPARTAPRPVPPLAPPAACVAASGHHVELVCSWRCTAGERDTSVNAVENRA